VILTKGVDGAEDKKARFCKKISGSSLFSDLKRVLMAGIKGKTSLQSHMVNLPARTLSPARLSKDG